MGTVPVPIVILAFAMLLAAHCAGRCQRNRVVALPREFQLFPGSGFRTPTMYTVQIPKFDS
eukprot:6193025-Pleurochrysis_carterae.AAC.3